MIYTINNDERKVVPVLFLSLNPTLAARKNHNLSSLSPNKAIYETGKTMGPATVMASVKTPSAGMAFAKLR